tara:strand:+ start:552 stop:713 length:162 start_codon:yes stop_codon:yes gene_type:complete
MFTAGFLLFLVIFGLAFWVLLFLSAFALPFAITQYVIEKFKGKKAPATETIEE